jgi:hypothetical protein
MTFVRSQSPALLHQLSSPRRICAESGKFLPGDTRERVTGRTISRRPRRQTALSSRSQTSNGPQIKYASRRLLHKAAELKAASLAHCPKTTMALEENWMAAQCLVNRHYHITADNETSDSAPSQTGQPTSLMWLARTRAGRGARLPFAAFIVDVARAGACGPRASRATAVRIGVTLNMSAGKSPDRSLPRPKF